MPASETIMGFKTGDTRFMTSAACRKHDTDIFIEETQTNIKQAKQICAECPVRAECLTYALQLPTNTIGIYAGKTTAQLNTLRNQQDRLYIRHGTIQGYNKERRNNLPTCDLCRTANTNYHLARKRQRA